MAGNAHNSAEVGNGGGRNTKKRSREMMKMIDVKLSGFEEDNKCCCCCRECGKRFGSPKALYGHMRCHPERWWRGINPPSLPSDQAVVEKNVDHEVADCLLMLSNGRTVVGTKSSADFLNLNVLAPVEQLPHSVCSSSSLNLELSLS